MNLKNLLFALMDFFFFFFEFPSEESFFCFKRMNSLFIKIAKFYLQLA